MQCHEIPYATRTKAFTCASAQRSQTSFLHDKMHVLQCTTELNKVNQMIVMIQDYTTKNQRVQTVVYVSALCFNTNIIYTATLFAYESIVEVAMALFSIVAIYTIDIPNKTHIPVIHLFKPHGQKEKLLTGRSNTCFLEQPALKSIALYVHVILSRK